MPLNEIKGYLLIVGFCFFLSIVIYAAAKIIARRRKEKRIIKKILSLSENAKEITVDEFFSLRNARSSLNNVFFSSNHSFSGVYVLHNITKDIYYVGQAQNVINRVNMHFTGKGNGDVYADYKYGDVFSIRMLALKNSGFDNLNDLERHAIKAFDAYHSGYNKNRGNIGG